VAKLTTLKLNHFRNCEQAHLSFAPKLNLLIGDNAAGKTSVIESLWFLVSGRSFRSSKVNALIQHSHEQFIVFAEMIEESGLQHKVGLQKSLSQSILKLDDQKLSSHAEVARTLPIQMLTPESHKLLEEGPKARRQFIDWGCFYQNLSLFSIGDIFKER